ncbi:transposon ty3-g Gag-Pol polyprotein [Plakobranchus ocellatus]|uniref:Transposon ty3-g Gag-Pol polyprotein n=1 Tax=Plakobranchus ocellatus TaxID=259542 RepID=A0AAV3ZDI5_9GAST|nr:transposon ty3-g Gag-Pol polyprotein [Plakobranchus ocellatus]
MPYEFTLIYRPGKDAENPADYLSRHPTTKPSRHNDGENYVNYVANGAIPSALSLEEVRKETKQDRVLVAVMTSISQFQFLKDELTIHDGIILRQHRIVIPESLRLRDIKLAHSTHQGVVKTKQLLREKVWFPGIDKLVESHLKECIPCQSSVTNAKQRDPLKISPLPKRPWDELSAGFAGPFPSGDYLLIVIDDYSRFPEVEIVKSTSAHATIPKIISMFSRFGTPSVLKTDNGAPFSIFAQKYRFKHRKITPLWPEANGEAERFVRSLNKFVHTCQAEHSEWKEQLPNFLYQYRATPHSSTRLSPHEALTGKKDENIASRDNTSEKQTTSNSHDYPKLNSPSPQQGDLRLSGPSSGQGTNGGARTPDGSRPCRSQDGLTSHCATDAPFRMSRSTSTLRKIQPSVFRPNDVTKLNKQKNKTPHKQKTKEIWWFEKVELI